MTTPIADLHLHTVFSDGTETPACVVELAHQMGLSCISITDHDTMDSLPAATAASQRVGIELIPGIEMSACADRQEVHVLGFFLDPVSPVLVQHMEEQKARRVERIREMVRRLQAIGVQLDLDEVFRLGGEGTIGRPHVARALVNRGYVSSLPEAFEKYLGPKHPAFVPGSPLTPAQVIDIIRQAGGVPVLAHPIYLDRDPLIDTFAAQGLAGLEVYHSSHTPAQVARYARIADRLGLVKTGGSDYHGRSKEGVAIGASTIPYQLVESLKQWQRQHPASSTRS